MNISFVPLLFVPREGTTFQLQFPFQFLELGRARWPLWPIADCKFSDCTRGGWAGQLHINCAIWEIVPKYKTPENERACGCGWSAINAGISDCATHLWIANNWRIGEGTLFAQGMHRIGTIAGFLECAILMRFEQSEGFAAARCVVREVLRFARDDKFYRAIFPRYFPVRM
jgi:hypothetical protein